MYIDIHCHLKDSVRRKLPNKWRMNSGFYVYDSAPAHPWFVVKDFLEKNNVTTLEHPPYCPDLAVSDFFMFTWLK